jgi:type IX secretion system PorP/SprF family membrane protein
MIRARNIVFVLAVLFVTAGAAHAQQVAMYNHYFFKPMVYNPAFAGAGEQCDAMLLSRSQWLTMPGAPHLNLLTVDGPVKNNKFGLGATLLNERRGIMTRNGGNLAYSYRLAFNSETYFLLGLSFGVVNHSIDYNKALAEDYSDPTLMNGIQQRTAFDANAGFAFIWKGLELAASAPQLLANRLTYTDAVGTPTFYQHARHYMASLKYRLTLSKEKDIGIAPQVLIRMSPPAPMQFDANLTFDWAGRFWLGGTYKSDYAISINAGIWAYRRVGIGYSYEVITADIGSYAGTSHEIMVNFRFGGGRGEEPDTVRAEEDPGADKANAYQQRIDSLQQALDANQEQIRELNNKLGQQAAAQEQTQAQLAALEKNMQNIASQQSQSPANTQQNQYTTQNAQTQSANTGNQATGGGQTNTANQQAKNTGSSEGKTSSQGNTTASEPKNTQASNAANQASTSGADAGYKKPPAALDMMDSKVFENGAWIASNPATGYKDENNANPKAGFYIVVGTFFYQDFAIAEMQRFRKRGYKGCNWVYSENTKHNYIFTNKVASRQEAIRKVREVQQTSGVKDAWILELK